MVATTEEYDAFVKGLEEKYPIMYGYSYGGICVGKGWWPIIESLSRQINGYVEWRNDTRERLLQNNPNDFPVPEEVPPVVVTQVKEKFGGLRFYYNGGDSKVDGMVRMAEAWADHTCETCGVPGKLRKGGWLRTLCDEHEAERQEIINKRMNGEFK